MIWHSLHPSPKGFLIDQYSLMSTTLPSGSVFLQVQPVDWASWIMKEESSLFYWFNGSGPCSGLLTGSKRPIHTHTHIHVITRHQIFEQLLFFKWSLFLLSRTEQPKETKVMYLWSNNLSSTCEQSGTKVLLAAVSHLVLLCGCKYRSCMRPLLS